MKKQWVIKRIDTKVVEHTPHLYTSKEGDFQYYYAGKRKGGQYTGTTVEFKPRDMFAAFNTVNADKIQLYTNHATAILDLQEITEPGRYVIEPHFVIEK